ncbi:hypothetical protein [Neisseria polysaccharea]|uniref:hypothetical protein n=2 Tax=Neisseria polysaccharea TaxID=489 RepID=UPI00031BA67B
MTIEKCRLKLECRLKPEKRLSDGICSRYFQRILTSFRRHLGKPNLYPLQFEPEDRKMD